MTHVKVAGKDPLGIRLSGAGGQGMVTAGVILAEAALLDGKNVVQTQSYGPEARLGASRSEVILSTRKIAYPQVTKPDVLLCMSQDAFRKFITKVNSDAVVLLDATNIELGERDLPEGPDVYALPITATAATLGSKLVANVVALGAMNALLGIVSPENLRKAVARRVPERFRELNERALKAGIELVQAAGRTKVS
jgi:2-oxoglutarate ferredoxin oxidoreductase subunit gamma